MAVRIYEWSRRDLFRELQEGCPLLSSLGLNNRFIAAFVKWNETLSAKERKALAIALTKSCHENAVRLKGEAISTADIAWKEAVYFKTRELMEDLPPLATANREASDFECRNPDRCLSAVTTELSQVAGKTRRLLWKVQWSTHLADWKILTEFFFHKGSDQLSFEYHFIRSDGRLAEKPHPAQGPMPRTMLFFYGLGHSFVWVISRVDEKPMAKVITKLARYFVAQAGPLFEGLGIND